MFGWCFVILLIVVCGDVCLLLFWLKLGRSVGIGFRPCWICVYSFALVCVLLV